MASYGTVSCILRASIKRPMLQFILQFSKDIISQEAIYMFPAPSSHLFQEDVPLYTIQLLGYPHLWKPPFRCSSCFLHPPFLAKLPDFKARGVFAVSQRHACGGGCFRGCWGRSHTHKHMYILYIYIYTYIYIHIYIYTIMYIIQLQYVVLVGL